MRRKKDRSNGITALYERLSRDDDNAGESNSIVHQKQMLEDYAIKHGFTNLVHFTDDGWSGATFDRPSWNRLVEGVKNGEITACICKDMSRIGRDHLQVGFFTDILFREKEVRFIAINNGIDSDRQETSEFAPFLNIMNEWFVRDTSKKIKAVLKSRGSSGNAHTSNIPPYGYLKDPENPDHWIIDEEAAEVVRRIYRMTIEGKGPYQIARELSEEKIERPSYYLGKKGLGNHASNYDKENPYMWRGNQVTTLIARPEYIGKTVNFRTFKNSYKDKKTKRADKEDWVVFDDTQEPIVDEETWLLAQKLRQNVRKADPMGEPNVLTGKIYCADCGAPMYNHRQRKAVKATEDDLLSICMHLAFSCSMRIGEITGLTWEDVIIDEESIATNNAKVIINKELSRVNAEAMQKLKEKDILKIFPTQKPHCTTRLVLKTPKTETSNRVVWLPKTVAELLVQYKKDQQELKEFLGSAYNDYNLVIALDNGNPVESRIVRDRFQKLCEENDYEVVVFHSLRHLSTGYKLKMTNGDVKSVQGDTGHAEAEMVTDVYSEIIDEDRRFNAQKMDKEFYSTLNDDTDNPKQDTDLTDSDMALLELIKSLSPEMKEQFLKQALQR